VPAIVTVVWRSNAAALIRFLMNPCHHYFTTHRRKLDVARQTDTGNAHLIRPVMRKEIIMVSRLPVSRQDTALTKLR